MWRYQGAHWWPTAVFLVVRFADCPGVWAWLCKEAFFFHIHSTSGSEWYVFGVLCLLSGLIVAKIEKLLEDEPDLQMRYKKSLLESYIEDNQNVRWCPSVPHCGRAIQVKCWSYCSWNPECCSVASSRNGLLQIVLKVLLLACICSLCPITSYFLQATDSLLLEPNLELLDWCRWMAIITANRPAHAVSNSASNVVRIPIPQLHVTCMDLSTNDYLVCWNGHCTGQKQLLVQVNNMRCCFDVPICEPIIFLHA